MLDHITPLLKPKNNVDRLYCWSLLSHILIPFSLFAEKSPYSQNMPGILPVQTFALTIPSTQKTLLQDMCRVTPSSHLCFCINVTFPMKSILTTLFNILTPPLPFNSLFSSLGLEIRDSISILQSLTLHIKHVYIIKSKAIIYNHVF